MSRFQATPQGIRVELPDAELAVISRIGSLLGGAGAEPNDPATTRLNPILYPDDEVASREFDRLAAKERVEARSADRERFVERLKAVGLGEVFLSQEDAAIWARVIGESRIVLAARKGYFDSGLPDDPVNNPEAALVMFLGILQEELVGELLASMKEK